MAVPSFSIAVGTYGLTEAIKNGDAVSQKFTLKPVEITPITAAMRRMVRGLEFDICEMAVTTYLCAKALGKPVTAIPVFVTRNFHHWAIWHNVKAGIKTPKDLEGRTVAVNRGYTVTTGLWARAVLQHEHGVDLAKVQWSSTDDEHVAEFVPPPNADYALKGQDIGALLASGAVAAAIGDVKATSPDVRQLLPDARKAGFAWFRKTGIYPMNHTIVIKDSVIQAHPWLPEALWNLFKGAKLVWAKRLEAGAALSAADKAAGELAVGVGGDPFPYGVAANRKGLEALTRYCVEQHITPRKLSVDEL
ncbi:MAG: ABC transporter substrate-binding protein, partial [Alphaproteobacteria bacterium]|nr:ABC transporter substrate-binding protein [Alphaproteobacteria bacterium]